LNKTAKRLKTDHGAIVLCAMKDYVREVFEISGFDTFLPIVSSLGDAVQKHETAAETES
jgi:anti-sigma B factor antagonist